MSKFTRDDAGHFAGNTMPFRDWDADGEVPFGCVKCHTAGGLPEFLKNGGTTVVSPTGSTTDDRCWCDAPQQWFPVLHLP